MLSGEGVNELVEVLKDAKCGKFPNSPCEVDVKYCTEHKCIENCDACNYWNSVGYIVSVVQDLKHRHHTLLERFSDFTLHPVGGLIVAILVLLSTLFLVREIGENATKYILEPFYNKIYSPLIFDLANALPLGFLKGLLVGYSTDPLASFGILTSGVYIA